MQPIIVVNQNTPRAVETFAHLGRVRALKTSDFTRASVSDADILIVRSETKVNRDLLEGSRVKFVGTVTIGTDHVDIPYLESRKITFASAPGSNANSVAEYLAAALLVWSQRTGAALSGKTLGVVGVGSVGSKVAEVGRAFGMQVLLNDPPLARGTMNSPFRPIEDLMSADVVSLHVPLTTAGQDPTHHLFDEQRILKMKTGSVLINTSRGPVVESTALRSALFSKHLSHAILDVWEGEPRIETGLLDQVTIGTPHIAGYSLDGKLNAVRMIYEEVCRFVHAKPEWKSETVSKDSPKSKIRVDETAKTSEAVAHHAIRQAYDIELDDRELRKIMLFPPGDQAAYFMKLRAEYRVRREFVHWLVELSPEQSATRDLLARLGFRVALQVAA